MLIIELINWWYGHGFRAFGRKLLEKLGHTADFFSVGTLLKTLFLPFRQISAGKVDGSLETRLRATFDRLISRLVGATIRFFLIVAGFISLAVQSVFSLVAMLVYPFMPAVPIFCFIIAIGGVL